MATMWKVFARLKNINLNYQLPEKYNKRFVGRVYNYTKALILDYVRVGKEVGESMQSNPFKSFVIVNCVGVLTYIMYCNPNERDYMDQILEYQNLFGLVGKPVRNPSAEVYLKYLHDCFNYGIIRRFSLGFFSIIWLDNYDSRVGLYKAQCTYLKPEIRNFYERIVDVGFMGKYWIIEKKMEDYDVNPNEWIDFSKTEYGYKHRISS